MKKIKSTFSDPVKCRRFLGRAVNVLLVLGMLFSAPSGGPPPVAYLLLPGVAVAHAQEGTGGNTGSDAVDTMVAMFKELGNLFITAAYSLMFIIFAVGMVKSGVAAQAAQQFGVSGRVSMEMLNVIGGIAVFIFGLLTLPLVNLIIDKIQDLIPSNTDIYVPDF
jgi:hypothetical protein